MILALATLAALAGPTPQDLSAYAMAGFSALPDAMGDAGVRSVQELGLEVPIGDDLHVSAMGALRSPHGESFASEANVYRLAFHYYHRDFTLAIGRLSRLDSRGWLRIDGFSFEDQRCTPLTFAAYAGTLWHPEELLVGGTAVAGVELRFRPKVDGRVSNTTQVTAGYELRLQDKVAHRVHASGTHRGANGGRAMASVEVGFGDDSLRTGLRAVLDGRRPVGSHLSLGGDVRYEGLAPSWYPEGVRSPMDWLAPDGYGAATAQAGLRSGKLEVVLAGGGVVRPDNRQLGEHGRLSVGLSPVPTLRLGAFGAGAGMADAYFGGGGLEARVHTDAVELTADGGLYAFQGLDGETLPVWETRLRAEAPLVTRTMGELEHHLALAAELAAGTDRVLAPWSRAGLALHGRVGHAGWGRP